MFFASHKAQPKRLLRWAVLHFVSLLSLASNPIWADTVPGKIPGELTVEQGEATYSIPIDVVAGRAGVQPNLSLVYSSGLGNGTLGVGWQLDGISMIHRCQATLAQDGMVSGINFNANDRYCFNGERLVPVGHSEYRTEIDSYAKITAQGGDANNPDTFTVITKAGDVLTFGGESASHNSTRGTLSWSLQQLNTLNGNNPVNYYYFTHDGSQYLSHIEYSAGKVVLEYEARTDHQHSAVAGHTETISKRLKNLRVFASDTLQKTYQLDYSYQGAGVQQSVISRLQLCAENSHCIATDFSWMTSDEIGLSNDTWQSSTPSKMRSAGTNKIYQTTTGDFNGDGMTDTVTM